MVRPVNAPGYVSPRLLSLAIGVSESSLKRWVDQGRLQVSRTAGGHRRIPTAEAVRFIRAYRHDVRRPELLGLAPGAMVSGGDEALLEALVRGESSLASSLVSARYLAGQSVASLADAVLCPILSQLGERWRHGVEGIAEEHLAVDTCLQALPGLRALLPTPAAEAPLALGGAPAGDPYLLPSQLAALTLLDLGWRTINTGPDTPLPCLLGAVRRHRPRLVWLACTGERGAMAGVELAAFASELARVGTALALGGRAAPEVASVERLSSFGELAALARQLGPAAAPRP